jgi:hypothetical protein
MKINLNTLLLIVVIGLALYVNNQHNFSIHRGSKTEVVVIDREPVIREPRRHYDSRYYPRRAMEINIPTRGEPPQYQQVGYLKDDTDSENIKPLYGRQTYRGSNQWNYFTSMDSHLATKIPIEINNRDCTDERGCKELYKDDSVNLNGKTYQSNIYNTRVPRYIPY